LLEASLLDLYNRDLSRVLEKERFLMFLGKEKTLFCFSRRAVKTALNCSKVSEKCPKSVEKLLKSVSFSGLLSQKALGAGSSGEGAKRAEK